jgi:hypothetical protein
MLATIKKIVNAFYDKDKGAHMCFPRTWGNIKRLTGLSAGVLSKHMRTLINQDVVKVEKKLGEDGKLKTFYTYTRKAFTIEGKIGQTEVGKVPVETGEGTIEVYTFVPKEGSKQPSTVPAARVHFDRSVVKDVEWGYSRRGRKRKLRKDEISEHYKVEEDRIETVKPKSKSTLRETRYFVKDKRVPVG